ncbi:MAG: ATP-binding protein, partial [Candidatus Methanomethyliaceae archaeon]
MTFPFLLFFSSFISFTLAGILTASEVRTSAARSFCFLLLIHACYSLLLGLFWSIPDLTNSTLVARLLFAVPALIPKFFLSFTTAYEPSTSLSKIARHSFLSIIVPVLFCLLSLSPLIVQANTTTHLGPRPIYGPLFPAYALYFLTYLSIGLLALLSSYTKVRGIQKERIRYAIVGIIPGFSLIVLFTIVLPLFGVRELSSSGPIVSIPMLLILTYAISKNRLLDVRAFLRKLLSLGGSVSLCAGLASLLLGYLLSIVPAFPTFNVYLIGSICTMLCGIGVFPVRRALEILLDHFVFSQVSNYYESLKTLRSELRLLRKTEDLTALLAEGLKTVMGSKKVTVVYAEDHQTGQTLARSGSPEQVVIPEATMKKAFGLLNTSQDVVVLDEIPPDATEFLELFEEMGCKVLIPLRRQEEVIGWIALEEKTGGDFFSSDEINFLADLGHEVSVLLENARLYAALFESKEYMENVLSRLTCGVVTVDSDGNLTAINAKACELLGKNGKEVLGKHVTVLGNLLADPLLRTLRGKESVSSLDLTLLTREGEVKFLDFSTTPLRASTDYVVGALGVMTDFTKVRLLEAEVRRVERLATVGTLAAGLAHEIKNPLVSLKTFAQLLPTKYDDPEFRDSFSLIATSEIERINTLVEQLLRFARPPKPIPIPIDVHEPLEQTLSLLASEFSRSQVVVRRNFHPSPLIVNGDSEQLKQVFMNVLLNALEALSPKGGGLIEVSTSMRKRWNWAAAGLPPEPPSGYLLTDLEAVVRVSDNGPGIRESHLKHVFDPFFTTKDTGHGLGLSIAHGIVREHRGTINAENKPGGGALFTIALPLLEKEARVQDGKHDELRA